MINICIATDNNYAYIAAVVMISAMENANDSAKLCFHIFEHEVEKENKQEMIEICESYNSKIYFYSIDERINEIQENIDSEWAKRNSYVTYARLFMADLLPVEIEKFIYLDCDTLVLDDLTCLLNTDMGNCVEACVKDVLSYEYKEFMGFEKGDYFNSGVAVINASLWRKENLTRKVFKYCDLHQSDLFPDQDATNVLLKNRIYSLDPKYCVFFPEYGWRADEQLRGYGGDEASFYGASQLEQAGRNPCIIHYTDSVIGRPWQSNNINPYSIYWMKYYNMLPTKMRFVLKEKNIGWRTRIYRQMYKLLPDKMFARIYYKRRNGDLRKRMKEVIR